MRKVLKDCKLLRLVSARNDIADCMHAYGLLTTLDPADETFRFIAASIPICYGKPFTDNFGLGNLLVEYPDFPDFAAPEMNLRHERMMKLRHKFMTHSSCDGTKLLLIPPGVQNPITEEIPDRFDHMVGKRNFGDIRLYHWLIDVAFELKGRLDADVRKRLVEIGGEINEVVEMETGYDDFTWSVPKPPPLH